jgi:hypothetical protein
MKSILTLSLVGFISTAISSPSVVLAQTFDFDTNRQLRTCPSRKAPTSGRISVEQAKKYVACYYEDKEPFNASVQFVDVLSLEIAPKTRRARSVDFTLTNIDTSKPIYELRGSIVVHRCVNITGSAYGPKRGKNCFISREPKAVGKCYQTPFSEWYCLMGGRGVPKRPEPNMPAPQ